MHQSIWKKSFWFSLLTLTLVCYAIVAHADGGSAKAWNKDRDEGLKAAKANDFPTAEKFLLAAVEDAKHFGKRDDRLAKSLDELGEFYFKARNYVAAEPVFQQLAELRKGDPNAALEATALQEYANASTRLKHYDQALETYSQMQDVVSKKLGANHPLAVDCMFFKARIYFIKGDYDQAIPWLKRSGALLAHPASRLHIRKGDPATYNTEIFREKFKPELARALEAQKMLQIIYIRQNKFSEATAALDELLNMVDTHAKDGDPALLNALTDISDFYVSITNFSSAELVLQRLIKLQNQKQFATNGSVLDSEAILANVYVMEKKNAEAGVLYKKILVDADAKFGPESRPSSVALANLAKFDLDQGRFDDAEPLYRRELAQTEKFHPDSAELLPILNGQEMVYQKLNRDPELLEVYQRELKIYEKMFGPDHGALVPPLSESAKLLRKQKKDAEADALELRIKSIQAAQVK